MTDSLTDSLTFDPLDRYVDLDVLGGNCWIKNRAENVGIWEDLIGGFRASLEPAPEMPTPDGSYQGKIPVGKIIIQYI